MAFEATAWLVERAIGVRLSELPSQVREVASHCVLDLLGVTIAGSQEPSVETLEHAVGLPPGSASVIGRAGQTDARTAALLNGVSGHALDYDDTHWTLRGHPTVAVLPAVLALAEVRGRSGAALLEGLVAGVEVACHLGALLNPEHYAIGFHATGTLGAFGAAAGCARLLGLDRKRFAHALGLAGTQAAGLKSGFGTMAKALHAGRAAECGVLSALLAERGFTGNPSVVEVPQGFASTHGMAGQDLGQRASPGGERFLICDTLFKFHAACYLTHAAIDASRSLVAEHGFSAGDVVRVVVTVSPTCLGVCDIAEPSTGLEGKFSLRTAVAMGLLGDDTASLLAYTDARMADPALRRLRDIVEICPREGEVDTRSTVRLELRGGGARERTVDTGVPATDLAAQRLRLEAKFRRLVDEAIGPARSAAILSAVARLGGIADIRELTALVTTPGPGRRH